MPPTPFWAKPRFVLAVIFAYLAVHFAIRMALPPTLATDDSEQALFAQQFAWTYRYRAPPLFTWLLVSLGQVMPVNAASIGIVRYALLGIAFVFAYLTARRLILDSKLAALSVYSFAAIHTFAESSHRELTHATALAALVSVAWYVFVRLCHHPRLGWYLALGATFGLGLLAKWNFVILADALPIACLLRRDFRPLVLTWRIIPAAALAAVLALPTAWAALSAGPPPGEDVRSVFSAAVEPGLRQIWNGTIQLMDTAITYPLPFLLILVAVLGFPLWRGLSARPLHQGPLRPDIAFIGATVAIGLALIWTIVPLLGATEFKVRYMYPALFVTPVWLFMIVERGRPSERATQVFALILVVLAVAVPVDRLYKGLWASDCGICIDRMPFQPIASRLRVAQYDGSGTILADSIYNGGNLRAVFPQARVIVPGFSDKVWPAPKDAGPCLVIWERHNRVPEAVTPPPAQAAYLADVLNADHLAPSTGGEVSAPLYGVEEPTFQLAYRLYNGPLGECR